MRNTVPGMKGTTCLIKKWPTCPLCLGEHLLTVTDITKITSYKRKEIVNAQEAYRASKVQKRAISPELELNK